MAEKEIWKQQNLTCKPLDSLEEISQFLQDPPCWRSLCVEIKRHSENVVKNTDINKFFGENLLETPQTFCHYDPEADGEVPRHRREKLPKTLVCHDMANGYHDDCVIDGTGNYDAYTFYNWGAVDIFCYFSHHFITIPPLGWINVGHAHGVKVIGTVITEWGEGEALWNKILQSEAEWRHFASALVAIAKTLRFDGWLLNIENKIAKPDVLLQFVRHLHELLHRELRDPLLLWYDSVTVEGNLHWQNGLNANNKAFFEAVDGLFTNYSWSLRDVEGSVAAAGARATDLFLGVDVWGRNFYGGGQFNTQEAVRVAYEYGCSLAIFAPAWTHEARGAAPPSPAAPAAPAAPELDSYGQFLLRERALWGSLWPFLNTKLPCQLPFHTSFCRGQGKKRRLYGEVICPVPWYNLNHQQYQPNCSHGPHGYLLSTEDTITNLSYLGILKDSNGISRYRRSLEMTQIELTSAKNKDQSQPIIDDNTLSHEEVVEVPGDERQSEKKNMIDMFRQLFNMAGTTENADKFDACAKNALGIGRSMGKMPVNLRIGDKTGKTRYALAYVPAELECLEPFFEDSFVGGSCLKVNPSDEVNPEHRLSRLFFCDFECKDSLIACIVTKTLVGCEDQFLNIWLSITDGGGRLRKVVLVGRDMPDGMTDEEPSMANTFNVYPMSEVSDPGFKELQTYLVVNEPGFYVPVANAYGWKVRYYEVGVGVGARVRAACVRAGRRRGAALLGLLGFTSR